eukprot:407034-Rhodomonas_salina.1
MKIVSSQLSVSSQNSEQLRPPQRTSAGQAEGCCIPRGAELRDVERLEREARRARVEKGLADNGRKIARGPQQKNTSAAERKRKQARRCGGIKAGERHCKPSRGAAQIAIGMRE